MTKYALCGRFGSTDHAPGHWDGDTEVATLDIGSAPLHFTCGIGKALKDLRKINNVRPTEIGIDLMVLAVHVHAADIRLNRGTCSQDGWTREIVLVVPVSDPTVWDGAVQTLETMLRFLTGDHWEIRFRSRPANLRTLRPAELPGLDPPRYDGVSLYSGGLDSLIGAIDEVVSGNWPLFVSHAGEGAVSRPQADLFDSLRSALMRHTGGNRQIERLRYAARFPRRLYENIGPENTTRGRSFLFLALGAAAGTGLGGDFELRIPENGFIALNVPLDPTRLGSSTTRTTHPFYIRRWNDLLATLGIPGRVVNPYWAKTKGEMVQDCLAPTVLHTYLAQSVSCAHPSSGRFSRDRAAHCGVCVPCLIRRAAVRRAWGPGADPTTYRCEDIAAEPLDAMKADARQIRGYEYALKRLDANPNLASIVIHKPGSLLEDAENLEALTGMYRRGMEEIKQMLSGARTYSSRMPA